MGAALDALLSASDFSMRACDLEPMEAPAGGLLAPAFHPLLRTAAQWLDTPQPVAWRAGARRGLLSSLARRWIGCTSTLMYAELHAAGLAPSRFVDERLATRQQWLALLARHPVVAALMELSLLDWQRHIARLGRRLAGDAPALALATPLAVDALAVHAGEYEGRRWTVSLALGERRLIYRPRDLRIVPWFMRVCALLNESLTTPLHVRRVLAGGDHAWDEFVTAGPCRDAGEVGRFYRRIGVLMRLLQMLRATDMHARNLVGAGEHPVIIDVETLLQAPRSESAVERAQWATPLETGLLPFWIIGDPGRRAVEGSALGRGERVTMPYRVPVLAAPETAQAAFTRDYAPPEPAPTILPARDGILQLPRDHVGEILDGYGELDEILAREDRLDALLAEAAELPVRAFVRGNVVYRRAQHDAQAPSLLRDPAARERALLRMLAGPGGERFAQDPVVRSEVRALAELRLPRFASLPGADALLCPDGTRVAGYFAGSALGAVERRQPAAQRARNLDLIRSAIALADPSTVPPPPRAGGRPLALRDAALAICDLILDEGIRQGDELYFFGAAWVPWAAARPLGPLPHDLVSGNAGLAIALAAAHRQSGAARFADGARAALAPVRRAVERELPRFAQYERDPAAYPARWLFCGAFHGIGAQLLALSRCRALLDGDRDALADDVPRLFPLPLAGLAPRDVTVGLPGFLLAAATLGPLPPRLTSLLERLDALPAPPYPDGTPPFLPPPPLSVSLARVRLAGAAPAAADGPLLYRLACDRGARAEVDAALTAMPPSLESLELALAAGHPSARDLAAGLVARQAATGRWLDGAVADRHHLSALTGLAALALALLRVEAPELGSLRLLS